VSCSVLQCVEKHAGGRYEKPAISAIRYRVAATATHHTITHCNTLQHTATRCNTIPNRWSRRLFISSIFFNTLQHAATRCNTLQLPAPRGNNVVGRYERVATPAIRYIVAVCCSVLQCVAVCYSVLSCVAVCCRGCCRVLRGVAVCCRVLP